MGYGAVEVLHGVDSAGRRGRAGVPARRQRRGQEHDGARRSPGCCAARRARITFRGERLDGRPAHAVLPRGIAQCPEGRRIFPEMTVRENLEMGAYVRGRGGARRDDLERVFHHFPRLAGARAASSGGTLSGGEQQMLAIGAGAHVEPRAAAARRAVARAWPRPWSRPSFASSRRSAGRASPCSWSSRTRRSPSAWPTAATSWRTAASPWRAARADLLDNADVRRAYLGG